MCGFTFVCVCSCVCVPQTFPPSTVSSPGQAPPPPLARPCHKQLQQWLCSRHHECTMHHWPLTRDPDDRTIPLMWLSWGLRSDYSQPLGSVPRVGGWVPLSLTPSHSSPGQYYSTEYWPSYVLYSLYFSVGIDVVACFDSLGSTPVYFFFRAQEVC